MTSPHVGQVVHFRFGLDDAPMAAIVTATSGENVSLIFFQPGFAQGQVVDGCYHRSHQRAERAIEQELGCWETIEESEKRTKAMKETIEADKRSSETAKKSAKPSPAGAKG